MEKCPLSEPGLNNTSHYCSPPCQTSPRVPGAPTRHPSCLSSIYTQIIESLLTHGNQGGTPPRPAGKCRLDYRGSVVDEVGARFQTVASVPRSSQAEIGLTPSGTNVAASLSTSVPTTVFLQCPSDQVLTLRVREEATTTIGSNTTIRSPLAVLATHSFSTLLGEALALSPHYNTPWRGSRTSFTPVYPPQTGVPRAMPAATPGLLRVPFSVPTSYHPFS